jgi:hypothetical protein
VNPPPAKMAGLTPFATLPRRLTSEVFYPFPRPKTNGPAALYITHAESD